jgi:hypothetical protein
MHVPGNSTIILSSGSLNKLALAGSFVSWFPIGACRSPRNPCSLKLLSGGGFGDIIPRNGDEGLLSLEKHMKQMNRYPSKSLLIVTFFVLVAGSVLRVASFHWNDRLQGDVNLFALAAREFVNHSRLYYPMKIEYSDHVEYQALQAPASYHPPLWSFVCGLLGKVFHTDDTFFILKVMCEIVGIFLIVMIVYVGLRTGWPNESLVAACFVALSPMLVDFSANGSFYMLSATMVILALTLIEHFHYQRITDYVLAGVLCGIGLQAHMTMVCIFVAFCIFWIREHSQLRWRGVLAFVFAGFLVLAPWMSWNLRHFGEPFYLYSSYDLLKALGLARIGIYGDVITTRITGAVDLALVKRYISSVIECSLAFLRSYGLEIGPFCFILAWVGCFALFQNDQRKGRALVLTSVLYTATFCGLHSFKYQYRFLVPVLPVTYIAAAFGFVKLYDRRPFWNWIGWICLAGTILWGIQGFSEQPPTRYYQNDSEHAANYEKMLPLARELGRLEPGVVLGCSRSLDGGFETVYWHCFPFVYGRGREKDEVQKLVHDFDVRYIWTDQQRLDKVESQLPRARIVLNNEFYYVLEIP